MDFLQGVIRWITTEGLTVGTAVGAAIAAAWATNKVFFEAWFKSRLTRIEEDHKSRLLKEVEELKSTLSTNLDRASKAHAREFEAASDLWSAAVEASASAGHMLSNIQYYPGNPAAMTVAQRSSIFETFGILPDRATEILASADPEAVFRQEIDAFRSNKAALSLDKFRDSMFKASIFLNDELYREFHQYFTVLADAVRENRVYPPGTGFRSTKARDEFLDNYLTRVEALRSAVYTQLWEHKRPWKDHNDALTSPEERQKGFLWWGLAWPQR